MCCESPEGTAATLDRRTLILGAAGTLAGAGLTKSLVWPEVAKSAGVSDVLATRPAPVPIPGGLDIPGVGVIHIFLPGPEDVTLPFSHLPLQGLDVEPSTITDFKGVSAVAMVAGKARGSDGATYNLEADIRAFRGAYRAADGVRRRGTFALI